MKSSLAHRAERRLASMVVAAACSSALLFSGCNKPANNNAGEASSGTSGTKSSAAAGPIHVKIAYLGLTCEAPIFVAYEKGFFKEEGLEPELVKTDWDGLASGLGLGKFDANHTLVLFLLKPLENGLDIKITGGIHTGCLRIQAGAKTEIHKLEDLRGKKIGVPNNLGSPPALFAKRVLAGHGFDTNKKEDVDWIPLDPAAMGVAVSKGTVDAVATAEPMGSVLLGNGSVRTVVDQETDAPYKDEYCCVSVVSGKLARENPEAASKVTRALLKGAKWVSVNPTAASNLSCEKKYVGAKPEMNAQAIAKLNYLPSVTRAKKTVEDVAKEVHMSGLLKSDPAELAAKAWIDLPGVTDEWIKGLEIEKVAGGGPVQRLSPQMLAVMFAGKEACCSCCVPLLTPAVLSADGKGLCQ